MQLPFLKNKRMPRIEQVGRESKLVNGSADDHIDDHCMGEIFDACERRDATAFRKALEALVTNLFDWEGGQ